MASYFAITTYDDESVTITATGLTIGNTIRFYIRLTSGTAAVIDEEDEATTTVMQKSFGGLSPSTSYTVNVHDGSAWIGAQTFTTDASSSSGGGSETEWDYISVSLGTVTTVPVYKSYSLDAYTVYRFSVTFETSGTATFCTTGDSDTYGYLGTKAPFNSSTGEPQSYLVENDDGDDINGDDINCYITYNVTAGTTYYFWVRMYDGGRTGDFMVSVIAPDEGWSLTTVAAGTVTETYVQTTYFDYYQMYRFSVKFENDGVATFYTVGSGDTIGYLSTTTGFDETAGEPTTYLTFDNDSGTSNNCSISYSVTAGTTYYFWVRMYSYGEIGNIGVYIEPPEETVKGNGQWYVYLSSGWTALTPYLYTSSGWEEVIPYIYDNDSGWD